MFAGVRHGGRQKLFAGQGPSPGRNRLFEIPRACLPASYRTACDGLTRMLAACKTLATAVSKLGRLTAHDCCASTAFVESSNSLRVRRHCIPIYLPASAKPRVPPPRRRSRGTHRSAGAQPGARIDPCAHNTQRATSKEMLTRLLRRPLGLWRAQASLSLLDLVVAPRPCSPAPARPATIPPPRRCRRPSSLVRGAEVAHLEVQKTHQGPRPPPELKIQAAQRLARRREYRTARAAPPGLDSDLAATVRARVREAKKASRGD